MARTRRRKRASDRQLNEYLCKRVPSSPRMMRLRVYPSGEYIRVRVTPLITVPMSGAERNERIAWFHSDRFHTGSKYCKKVISRELRRFNKKIDHTSEEAMYRPHISWKCAYSY